MKRLTLLATLLLSACATGVNVDYRPEADFSKFKSFTIEEKPANTTTDTRVNTPFMQERTVEALKQALTNKGYFYRKDKNKADVIVKYHLAVKQEFETDDSGVFLGFGTATRHSVFGLGYAFPDRQVASVDDLVLTIDFVDKHNILLWRGSYARRLYSGSTPEKNNALIQELVQDILKQFPPK